MRNKAWCKAWLILLVSAFCSEGFSMDGPGRDSLIVYSYGYVNFYSVYTRMQESYPDYIFPEKSLTFAPYPDPGPFNRNAEQPSLYLVTEAMTGNNLKFRMNISLIHSLNGFQDEFSKHLAFRTIPAFEITRFTSRGIFRFTAGDCSDKAYISPLTLSGQSLTTHPFERLPWDWYEKSFDKYRLLFSSFENPLQVSGLSASQGFVFEADSLFRYWAGKVFFGRTNLSLSPLQVYARHPSSVLAARLGYRIRSGSVSLQAYYHSLLPEAGSAGPSKNFISSFLYKGQGKRMSYRCEAAFSHHRVAGSKAGSAALTGNAEYTGPGGLLKIRGGLYLIPYDFAGIDNSVLNTNMYFTVSGLPNDHLYNLTLFVNPVQAPAVPANNRTGLHYSVGTDKGKIRFGFEQGWSREIEHVHDSLTFFHYDNAFTRSRFTPWLQGSGPYGRIGGRYRYTTETFPVFTGGEKLWFHASGLKIKYAGFLLDRQLILLINPSSRLAGLSFSEIAFRSHILDLTSFYQLSGKITLLGLVTLQNNFSADGIHQKGIVWGGGMDADIGKNAGLFIRYKKFSHADKNHTNDLFRGEEITTEIKIFF